MIQKVFALFITILLLFLTASAFAEAVEHEAFARQYATDMISGEKNSELYDLFTDDVKSKFPKEAFDALWAQTAVTCGIFEDFGSFEFKQSQGYDIYILRLNMTKKDLLLILTLDASGKVAGLNFDNAPKEEESSSENLPEGIMEEAVIVGEGKWALNGKLTLPQEGSSLPAVVLVHGSGPCDMNATIGKTKLFQDMAQSLAQNGIAVLRYDKRTFAHGALFTQADSESFTMKEEYVDDALWAGKLLMQHNRIDKERIFLVGHSQGAMAGPRIVSQSNGVFAGMILISGSPLPLGDIVIAQNEDVLAKLTEEQRATQQPLLDAEIQKLNALLKMTPEEAKKSTAFGLPGYYLYEMYQFKPAALVLDMKLPTLIMQGGADFQVSQKNGMDAWKNTLRESDFVAYKWYPELNHVMMKYSGDPALQYTIQEYNEPASLDETVASDMIDWLLNH